MRLRLDSVAHHLDTARSSDVEALVTELHGLFDHLDGLHADDMTVRIAADLTGCEDPERCRKLALRLIANHVGRRDGAHYFHDWAATVLCAYLHAAALSGRDMDQVEDWLINRATEEPARIIRDAGTRPEWASVLEDVSGSPARLTVTSFYSVATGAARRSRGV
jgi:hypothetical protein